jgi:hypothetical protein
MNEVHIFSESDESDEDHNSAEYGRDSWGGGPTSPLSAGASFSFSSHAQHTLPVEIYEGRLKRRIQLIREMRAAYLRDVVQIKQLMSELLTNDERELLFKQREASLPSLDLEKFFLSRPVENSFHVLPCGACGGTVEIVHHDSVEIQKLTAQLQSMDQSKGTFRLIIATKTAQLEELEQRLKANERSYREEVDERFHRSDLSLVTLTVSVSSLSLRLSLSVSENRSIRRDKRSQSLSRKNDPDQRENAVFKSPTFFSDC